MRVHLRRAVRSDLPDVLAIRREEDLDNRVDYLADRWNEWFEKPTFYPYVGESENGLVSLAYF